jgi:hypothetical protein
MVRLCSFFYKLNQTNNKDYRNCNLPQMNMNEEKVTIRIIAVFIFHWRLI